MIVLKRVILTIFSCFLFSLGSLQAQSNFTDPEADFKVFSYMRNQLAIPANPSAAGITKLGNHTLNNYTGAFSYNIPLYNLAGYSLAVPISLTYDGSGIKVQDKGSVAGVSWTLSAGGSITRSVVRHPDRNANYYDYGSAVNSTPNDPFEENDLYYEIQRGDRETQTDIYHYNFNGRAGKFYIRQDKRVVQVENTDLVITPYFDFFGDVTSFTITDDSGIQYIFSVTESYNVLNADVANMSCNPINLPSGMVWFDYTSAFHLSQITNPYSGEKIHFFYENVTITNPNYDLASNPLSFAYKKQCITSIANCGCALSGVQDGSPGAIAETKLVNRQVLQRIELRVNNQITQEVVFVTSGADATCSGVLAYQDSDKQLDEIIVRSYTSGAAYDLLRYSFDYDCSRNRLTLTDLDFCDRNGNNCHSFGFNYQGSVPLDIYSGAIDHWGYYNYSNPNYIIPCGQLFQPYSGCSSREAHSGALLEGRMTSIDLPTGGSLHMTYQANRVAGFGSNEPDRIVGGLRLSSLQERDIDGSVLSRKKYTYTLENYSSGTHSSSGVLISEPYYKESTTYEIDETQIPGWGGSSDPCAVYNFTNYFVYANSTRSLESVQGSIVGYSRITEQDIASNGDALNGKTVYNYISYRRGNYPNSDVDMVRNGKLRSVEYYDPDDNLLQRQTTAYSFEDSTVEHNDPSSIFYIFNVSTNPTQDNAKYLIQETSTSDPFWDYDDNTSAYRSDCYDTKFEFQSGNSRIIEHYVFPVEVTTEMFYYDEMGVLSSEISTTKTYEYEPSVHRKMLAEEMTNSDGIVYRTEYEYSDAYDGEANIKLALLDKNKLLPAYKTTQKVDGTIVDGRKTYYDFFGGTVLPESDYRYEYNSGSGSWQKQHEITAYNTSLRLAKTINLTDWPTDIELTYTSTGKIDSWQYGLYEKMWMYDENHNQVTTSENVDGTTTSYTYDDFLRLRTVTDDCRNVVTTYDYHYSGQTSGVGGSEDKNFVKTSVQFPVIAGSGLDLLENYSYADGLSRLIQQVLKNQSPQGNSDIVMSTAYDHRHRPILNYEAKENTGQGDYSSPSGVATATQYIDDVLDRVEQVTPPSWYATKTVYNANIAADMIDGYAAGELTKTEIIDPNGNRQMTFTDKQGRVICSRRSDNADTPASRTDTYTLYDEKNRVETILPPGTSLADTELIYTFTYDERDNMLTRKIPDSREERYLYDDRDLPVAMQNGVLYENTQWLVNIYDGYGRLKQKGLFSGVLPDINNIVIHNLLEEYFYDGYDGSNTISGEQYIGRVRKSKVKLLDDLGVNNDFIETIYTYDPCGRIESTKGNNHRNNSLTAETTSYTYDGADNVLTASHGHSGPDGTWTIDRRMVYDHAGRETESYITVNGGEEQRLSKIKYTIKDEIERLHLGGDINSALYTLGYTYNDQGWLLSINDEIAGAPTDAPCTGSSSSFLGPDDLFYLKLNYDVTEGQMPFSPYKNGNISSMLWQTPGKQVKGYSFAYDHLDRITDAVYGQYDVLAWTNTDFFTTEYSYDIRGNIEYLKRRQRSAKPVNDCYFAETIDSLEYSYYPNSNRLKQVKDKAPCPDEYTLPSNIERDESYSARLLIADVTEIDCRSTVQLFAEDELRIIDQLNITGDCSLGQGIVNNGCPEDMGHADGFMQNSATGLYTYDGAGNMNHDPNKTINIFYNHLNLPYKIVSTSGVPRELHIQYDASGAKLWQAYYKEGVLISRRDYIAGIEYADDLFESIQHEQGRITKDANETLQYEYHIRDHLGNTRLRFSDTDGDGSITLDETGYSEEILSQDHYYPFGMKMRGVWTDPSIPPSADRYGYNGKELLPEMDVFLSDYGGRYYDASLARWTSVDPLADVISEHSPFAYVRNNPIALYDPDGLLDNEYEVVTNEDGTTTTTQTGTEGGDVTDHITYRDANGNVTGTKTVTVEHTYSDNPNSEVFASTSRGPGYSHTTYGKANQAAETTFSPVDALIFGATKAGIGLFKLAYNFVSGKKSEEKSSSNVSTLEPGPYAKESIPAQNNSRNFSTLERNKINEIGRRDGCHTCGKKDPGTKSGNFVPDHQPPSAIAPSKSLYPHCIGCSRSQGGTVRQLKRKKNGT